MGVDGDPVVHAFIAWPSITAPCGREWRATSKDRIGDGMSGSWRFVSCERCLSMPEVRMSLVGQMKVPGT